VQVFRALSIRLPRILNTEQRFLTAVEVERVADAIGPYFAPLIYSAAYLGARWGELAGLKRDRVNLLKRQVTITGTLEEVAGRLRYSEETKTSASRRQISIPPFLCAILARHLETEGEFVFTSTQGALLRRSNFRRCHYKPALRAAGVDVETRFHDLRHTCAALTIEQGAHPMEVKARLGHASIKTTLDRYGHLMPTLGAHLDEALDRARQAAILDVARPGRGLSEIGMAGG
jgi:integrase